MATTAQPNGIPPSSSGSQTQPASQPTQNTITSGSTTIPNTQQTTTTTATGGPAQAAPSSPTTATQEPRPRDARTIELLLTSQGVTSFDNRVPLLLLDFAYRHTSSILNDALHLSGDPYATHAGAKPSGSSGAVPTAPPGSDATVSTNAINIAIASRQAYQFRGGSGGGGVGGGVGGGGASKEWLQELARERNKVVLPRILAFEWGVRLPNERFVLSGQSWGLRDQWAVEGGTDSSEDEADDDGNGSDAMEGVEDQNSKEKEGEEDGGGGLDEFLGDDMADEDMEGME
ncbi:transcription initiation factor IID, 31kD subunit-domain-containing protein [Xylaria bambusicola]|uniref:transcription initiation factor IID, 31kD subunit-domain-containing protein n=1 Tax=Xylaria bambusicola TaxID=326684 RepID=UPI002007F682|nr:transcription initiation factor IID, 31kD subunit-domain-containing protein [Xylaria bambusicola]KAI0513021.1 transcription initiation factor IID, 31kD subunit-domain-containing protein [Xylaria bambusicola]